MTPSKGILSGQKKHRSPLRLAQARNQILLYGKKFRNRPFNLGLRIKGLQLADVLPSDATSSAAGAASRLGIAANPQLVANPGIGNVLQVLGLRSTAKDTSRRTSKPFVQASPTAIATPTSVRSAVHAPQSLPRQAPSTLKGARTLPQATPTAAREDIHGAAKPIQATPTQAAQQKTASADAVDIPSPPQTSARSLTLSGGAVMGSRQHGLVQEHAETPCIAPGQARVERQSPEFHSARKEALFPEQEIGPNDQRGNSLDHDPVCGEDPGLENPPADQERKCSQPELSRISAEEQEHLFNAAQLSRQRLTQERLGRTVNTAGPNAQIQVSTFQETPSWRHHLAAILQKIAEAKTARQARILRNQQAIQLETTLLRQQQTAPSELVQSQLESNISPMQDVRLKTASAAPSPPLVPNNNEAVQACSGIGATSGARLEENSAQQDSNTHPSGMHDGVEAEASLALPETLLPSATPQARAMMEQMSNGLHSQHQLQSSVRPSPIEGVLEREWPQSRRSTPSHAKLPTPVEGVLERAWDPLSRPNSANTSTLEHQSEHAAFRFDATPVTSGKEGAGWASVVGTSLLRGLNCAPTLPSPLFQRQCLAANLSSDPCLSDPQLQGATPMGDYSDDECNGDYMDVGDYGGEYNDCDMPVEEEVRDKPEHTEPSKLPKLEQGAKSKAVGEQHRVRPVQNFTPSALNPMRRHSIRRFSSLRPLDSPLPPTNQARAMPEADNASQSPQTGMANAEDMTCDDIIMDDIIMDDARTDQAGSQDGPADSHTGSDTTDVSHGAVHATKKAPQSQRRNTEMNQRLKKMYKQRKSLAGDGIQSANGMRRSTRQRHRPLEWWRQETKIYNREHSSLPTVDHVVLHTPDSMWKTVPGGKSRNSRLGKK